MNQLKLFIDLTRLKKPIGYMLLFWPCVWGLSLAYDFSNNLENYFFYLLLFFLGAVLMRSAGCIVNDILDKEFDKRVFRTKNRPIASGKISIKVAIFYAATLCLLALFVLLNFNQFTIILALGSMPLAFTYPLMKRYTYWPQLFLGITFNYGLILGWTAIKGEMDIVPIIFYLGAIFWTLGYDTVYGYQDIKDDEIIGLKSTSIKFKKNAKKFLTTCYTLLVIFFLIGGYNMNLDYSYYLILTIPIMHLFIYQIKMFNPKNPKISLKIFKSNNTFGLLILINILIAKII
ncbi:4-hydroxybenzoate octaprenyltransferase [Candidatus Pelagibacter sp.]|nr:4-hydroxybenzoate octaprenyltransferase [Candidatus Pelagibacter bacterium]MDC0901192.1 4-hydroxybenzoate octaprenyltransferase [Candidatus Pelagibacter sp.]MDC1069701.1 4-hydroxybenzoate octaprenyltransferase [Candidatus Pelagibacter sp.]